MPSPRMPILRGTVVEGPVKVLEPDAGVRTPSLPSISRIPPCLSFSIRGMRWTVVLPSTVVMRMGKNKHRPRPWHCGQHKPRACPLLLLVRAAWITMLSIIRQHRSGCECERRGEARRKEVRTQPFGCRVLSWEPPGGCVMTFHPFFFKSK